MSDDQHQRDLLLLRRTVALAVRGPAADPNPRVGCVVVDRHGEVAGEGWHRGSGTPHAELAALAAARAAGHDLAGGTAYVSLEPCNHTGRTGPCAEALVAAEIARVVYAMPDPDPIATGGADTLARAGITTELVPLAEATNLNDGFCHAVTHGRPLVTWKLAATLDGRSAAADGSSCWITGETARADVHRLRATAGAVVVGTGTVLRDDPRLTVRAADGSLAERQPLRVVVGEREIPADARVLDDGAPTLRIRHRDPALVLATLHEHRVRHVWLEGGPTVAAAWLRAGVVDRVIAYVAPALLGAGTPAVTDLGIATIEEARRLTTTDVAVLDGDVRITMSTAPGPRGR
ncbi:bifunctional diaminohydroxyphosphoribosylaminopyrimidine deaminase/5-amino-6-(5-phosphoribosylamino)uracil reductase RibD [Arsenicicoccus sp. oral taxon 190]|uniref:bifunctional diaminohydroxyphosphoribosylaminopyrimidine deaminase/5-amino-6-(5-phosphoribosylamino)uracil reductase RibD n=1 Tax=Arsenicicoccus sp. oral taxon 190 TaxID=1658671 RepID=UPI00067A35C9|nr:bifunctional diaminohydroxyphosphoribosylaminopyrimidine deaminase/5-amino-6-(5-phosphoribosylamino)uracil reductase RibD [Arsenicicoccus sp. oral taxon 190]AKT51970.1 DeoR faimly transcriptional regulator [Arsenicicoccus sp. oral taxon 190]